MEQQGNETATKEASIGTTSTEKDENIWLRALVMFFFVIVTRIVEIVVVAVLITQFLFKLITKKPNQRLTDFGESLSSYIASIVRYQTFNTEDRPFPFSAWPKVDRVSTAETPSSQGGGVPPTQAQPS